MQAVTLQLPDELIALAGLKKQHLPHETLKLIVLELFREELVFTGQGGRALQFVSR